MGPLRTTTGIEITDSVLRIASVQSHLGRYRLLRFDQIEGFAGLSESEKANAVAALVARHPAYKARTFLTIPRRMGVCRQVELPVEVGERVGSAVALQIESLSPWTADEVYWDYAAARPGRGEPSIKVAVGIVPRAVLDPFLSLFRSAGLPVAGVGLSTMAQAHALVLDKKKSESEASSFVFGRNADTLGAEGVVSLPVANGGATSPQQSGAIAAALLGFGKTPFGLNLIPTADRFRHDYFQLVPTFVLAAAVLLLGAAFILRAPYQWHAYASSLDSEIEALKPAAAEVSAQEAELTKATTAYQVLKSRVETHDSNLEALRELARILPADCWLSSYSVQGRNMILSGFAQSASAVQKVLEESPLFENVQLSSSVTRDVSGKDRFDIKASIGVTP
jgi:Tfp pilus assembly protein PilN